MEVLSPFIYFLDPLANIIYIKQRHLELYVGWSYSSMPQLQQRFGQNATEIRAWMSETHHILMWMQSS